MWLPTQEEAVDMFARYLAAHHGTAAARYARETADKLLAKGDFANEQVTLLRVPAYEHVFGGNVARV